MPAISSRAYCLEPSPSRANSLCGSAIVSYSPEDSVVPKLQVSLISLALGVDTLTSACSRTDARRKAPFPINHPLLEGCHNVSTLLRDHPETRKLSTRGSSGTLTTLMETLLRVWKNPSDTVSRPILAYAVNVSGISDIMRYFTVGNQRRWRVCHPCRVRRIIRRFETMRVRCVMDS